MRMYSISDWHMCLSCFCPLDSKNDLCFQVCLLDSHIYVNVLHWMDWLYYKVVLVNEGTGLILVIQFKVSIPNHCYYIFHYVSSIYTKVLPYIKHHPVPATQQCSLILLAIICTFLVLPGFIYFYSCQCLGYFYIYFYYYYTIAMLY